MEEIEIRQAYLKLKQHTYYDTSNTNLVIRKTLAEFENLKEKERKKIYQEIVDAFSNQKNMDEFLDKYLGDIGYCVIPKGVKSHESKDQSIITNNRKSKTNYIVDRFNLIITAPIQIHLISVLWIMEKGVDLDYDLSDSCYGNRLLFKEDESELVGGRGCFKPYIRQYQAWRDNGVEKAKANLEAGIDVAIVNLDITEYYYHIKLNWNDLPKSKFVRFNLISHALLRIHQKYSYLLFKDYPEKFNFEKRLREVEGENDIEEVILPIGLLSSYVLANYYLKKWDNLIQEKLKPIYYGRYVDDMLIVISKPDSDYTNIEKFYNEKIESFNEETKKVPDSINFVILNLLKVLNIHQFRDSISDKDELDKVDVKYKIQEFNYKLEPIGFSELFLQPNKMMIYEFKADQSLAVIEKLKKDLEEKSSEFRFLPTDDDSFDVNAFELLYDDSFGKPKTLKDYKENRYGISAFLAKRIFASLRVERKNIRHESEKILAFFQGVNAVRFYQQWERIITYLIVNQRKIELLQFYKTVLKQLQKIEVIDDDETTKKLRRTLFQYLNLSLSLALSLDPGFFKGYLERQFNYLNNNPNYQQILNG